MQPPQGLMLETQEAFFKLFGEWKNNRCLQGHTETSYLVVAYVHHGIAMLHHTILFVATCLARHSSQL